MPHVLIKMWAGKSDAQKQEIADAVTKALMSGGGYGEESISVAIEDVKPSDWTEQVYKPDIIAKPETVYKKPGYNPL